MQVKKAEIKKADLSYSPEKVLQKKFKINYDRYNNAPKKLAKYIYIQDQKQFIKPQIDNYNVQVKKAEIKKADLSYSPEKVLQKKFKINYDRYNNAPKKLAKYIYIQDQKQFIKPQIDTYNMGIKKRVLKQQMSSIPIQTNPSGIERCKQIFNYRFDPNKKYDLLKRKREEVYPEEFVTRKSTSESEEEMLNDEKIKESDMYDLNHDNVEVNIGKTKCQLNVAQKTFCEKNEVISAETQIDKFDQWLNN